VRYCSLFRGVACDSGGFEVHANLSVGGSITAAGFGINAYDNAQVNVSGGISAASGEGVFADDGAQVTVSGGINAADGNGVVAANHGAIITTVTVTGNIFAGDQDSVGYAGIVCAGAIVTINGNVKADSIGVFAGPGSLDDQTSSPAQVTINGTLTAPVYILVSADENGDIEYTEADYVTPTTKVGYRTFTDGFNSVWVQHLEGGGNPQLPPASPLTLPDTGDMSSLAQLFAAGFIALLSGGAGLVLSLRRQRK